MVSSADPTAVTSMPGRRRAPGQDAAESSLDGPCERGGSD